MNKDSAVFAVYLDAPTGDLMRRVMNLLLLAVSLLAPLNAQTYEPTWDSVDKRPIPAWFSNAKFGIFIHSETYSVPSYAPTIRGKLAYAEWYWNAMTTSAVPAKPGTLRCSTAVKAASTTSSADL